ncbi:hypothetical protein FRB99_000024 [Tulasnella sp. 403]|nr:hypothetical protein FRB99_000024 [Tulasnella sp. 403]
MSDSATATTRRRYTGKAVSSDEDPSSAPPIGAAKLKAIHRSRQRQRALWKSPGMQVILLFIAGLGLYLLARPFLKGGEPANIATDKLRVPPKVSTINETLDRQTTSYMVVDIPGKGKGMIAARHIKRGELIMTDTPLFHIPSSTDQSPSEYIRQVIASLSPEGKAKFLSLSVPAPGIPEADVPFAIVQTNAFAAGPGMAVFPNAARLNHGCSSAFNVVYSFREEEKRLYVHALRDIQQGEELLTTYLDTKKPRAERVAFLKEHYGFECSCSVCSLPKSLSIASDIRLSSMQGLYQRLSTWARNEIDGVEAIKIVNRIWELGEEEGYHSERGTLAADAALVASAHSDLEATRHWRSLAAMWFEIELGPDHEEVQQNLQLVVRPESHPAWGMKQPMSVGGPILRGVDHGEADQTNSE